jgi:hypothetical protein
MLSRLLKKIEVCALVSCLRADKKYSCLWEAHGRAIPAGRFCLIVMKKMKRQLVLNKGTEKFIFRYEGGREDELLDALIEQAKDKRTDFDWFDAAVLSFKLTQSLIGQADELLSENTDAQIHTN